VPGGTGDPNRSPVTGWGNWAAGLAFVTGTITITITIRVTSGD